jgi:hypothetical protein
MDLSLCAGESMAAVLRSCTDLSLAVKAMRACLKARLPLDVTTVKRLRLACATEAFEVKQVLLLLPPSVWFPAVLLLYAPLSRSS